MAVTSRKSIRPKPAPIDLGFQRVTTLMQVTGSSGKVTLSYWDTIGASHKESESYVWQRPCPSQFRGWEYFLMVDLAGRTWTITVKRDEMRNGDETQILQHTGQIMSMALRWSGEEKRDDFEKGFERKQKSPAPPLSLLARVEREREGGALLSCMPCIYTYIDGRCYANIMCFSPHLLTQVERQGAIANNATHMATIFWRKSDIVTIQMSTSRCKKLLLTDWFSCQLGRSRALSPEWMKAWIWASVGSPFPFFSLLLSLRAGSTYKI